MKGMAIFCFVLVSFVGAGLMFTLWDFTDQYVRGNIVTYADILPLDQAKGLRIAVSDIEFLQSDMPPMIKMIGYSFRNPVEFFTAATMKIGYLVSGTRPYYSTFHNFFNLVWMITIYIGCYIGLKHVKDKSVAVFSVTLIAANCLLIGISSVDWDNRFYIPMEPVIVVLFGGGACYVFGKYKKRHGWFSNQKECTVS